MADKHTTQGGIFVVGLFLVASWVFPPGYDRDHSHGWFFLFDANSTMRVDFGRLVLLDAIIATIGGGFTWVVSCNSDLRKKVARFAFYSSIAIPAVALILGSAILLQNEKLKTNARTAAQSAEADRSRIEAAQKRVQEEKLRIQGNREAAQRAAQIAALEAEAVEEENARQSLAIAQKNERIKALEGRIAFSNSQMRQAQEGSTRIGDEIKRLAAVDPASITVVEVAFLNRFSPLLTRKAEAYVKARRDMDTHFVRFPREKYEVSWNTTYAEWAAAALDSLQIELAVTKNDLEEQLQTVEKSAKATKTQISDLQRELSQLQIELKAQTDTVNQPEGDPKLRQTQERLLYEAVHRGSR